MCCTLPDPHSSHPGAASAAPPSERVEGTEDRHGAIKIRQDAGYSQRRCSGIKLRSRYQCLTCCKRRRSSALQTASRRRPRAAAREKLISSPASSSRAPLVLTDYPPRVRRCGSVAVRRAIATTRCRQAGGRQTENTKRPTSPRRRSRAKSSGFGRLRRLRSFAAAGRRPAFSEISRAPKCYDDIIIGALPVSSTPRSPWRPSEASVSPRRSGLLLCRSRFLRVAAPPPTVCRHASSPRPWGRGGRQGRCVDSARWGTVRRSTPVGGEPLLRETSRSAPSWAVPADQSAGLGPRSGRAQFATANGAVFLVPPRTARTTSSSDARRVPPAGVPAAVALRDLSEAHELGPGLGKTAGTTDPRLERSDCSRLGQGLRRGGYVLGRYQAQLGGLRPFTFRFPRRQRIRWFRFDAARGGVEGQLRRQPGFPRGHLSLQDAMETLTPTRPHINYVTPAYHGRQRLSQSNDSRQSRSRSLPGRSENSAR